MPDPSDAELAAGSCRMIRAFPIALMAALRNDHSLERGEHSVMVTQLHQIVTCAEMPRLHFLSTTVIEG
jgi:hypothetical protein